MNQPIEKDRSIELDEEEAKRSEILNTDNQVSKRKKKPAAKFLGMDDNELEKSDHSDGLMAFSQRKESQDVSARDIQNKDKQFTRGKGFDSFAPCGPWITTADG